MNAKTTSGPRSDRSRGNATLRHAVCGLLAAALVPTAVTAAESTAKDSGGQLEEITVTGSRIARTNFETSTPVSSVDNTFIRDTAVTSLGDVLQTQPTFGIGLGSQNVNHSSSDAGSSFADLRGLGVQRTLVLVDGRRRVPGSSTSAAVDLSVIPPALIDSIEVITGGASAIYGADAVSGVVNIHLKRDIDGIIAGARTGIPEQSGGEETSAWFGAGGAFDDDRGHMSVAIGYSSVGQLASYDRDFAKVPWRLFANPSDTGVGDGQPSQIPFYDWRFSNFDRGGTICLPNADGTTSRFIAEAGGVRPFQAEQIFGGACGSTNIGGDGINTSEQLNLRAGVETYSFITSLKYSVTDTTTARVNLDYAEGSSDVVGEEVADSMSALRITRDNPFISTELAAELDARGLTSFGVGRSHYDLGRRAQLRDRDTLTAELAFDGKLGDWSWEAFGQYGEFNADTRLKNDRINQNFFYAVDAIRDPATGEIVCRNATARAAGCAPLNVLGLGVASQAALDYVRHTTLQNLTSNQTVIGGQLTGTAFELPAGPVQVAAGAEYREEQLKIWVDGLSRTRQLFQGLGRDNLSARFDVSDLFAEAVVPLLKDLPFAKSLEFEAAIRGSDYSTIGSTTTWRMGAVWAPIENLRFRVQRSDSVRAPSLFELYSPQTVARANVIDPCTTQNRGLTPNRAANCTALGIPAVWNDPRVTESEFIYSGGNETLDPEESESWTVGAVLQLDTPYGGFNGSIDYWDIKISDAIQSLNIERIVNGCVDSATINNDFCPLVIRDPSSLGILEVYNYALNLAYLKASGIDVQLQYAMDGLPSLVGDGDGRLDLTLGATHLLKREELGNAADKSTLTILDGEVGYPTDRINFQARYASGPISMAWTSRYISDVKLDVQMPKEFYSNSVNSVSSVFYHDIAAYYDWNDHIQFDFAIRNLTNQEPPRTPQHLFNNAVFAGIGVGGLYDNVGRLYSLGFSVKY